MILLVNKLKNVNPSLAWSSEKDIEAIITLLESSGFSWQESKKCFSHKDLSLLVYAKDISRFIGNISLLEEEIRSAGKKTKETKKEKKDNIRVASKVINFLVFLIIINLFLGWMVLHLFFWFLLEVIIVAVLVAFVKMRKKIKRELSN